MALQFGNKEKPGDQFREQLRILGTQIEAINQQLSQGGSASSGSPQAFSQVNVRLQYLHDLIKSLQSGIEGDLQSTVHQLRDEVGKVQQAMEAFAHKQQANPNVALSDIREALAQLVSIYREEMVLFRKQNEYIIRKVDEIEKRLG